MITQISKKKALRLAIDKMQDLIIVKGQNYYDLRRATKTEKVRFLQSFIKEKA